MLERGLNADSVSVLLLPASMSLLPQTLPGPQGLHCHLVPSVLEPGVFFTPISSKPLSILTLSFCSPCRYIYPSSIHLPSAPHPPPNPSAIHPSFSHPFTCIHLSSLYQSTPLSLTHLSALPSIHPFLRPSTLFIRHPSISIYTPTTSPIYPSI